MSNHNYNIYSQYQPIPNSDDPNNLTRPPKMQNKQLKRWNPERNWGYKPFGRKWRKRSPMFWIMPFELAGTVALLVLFAIAQPDLFRTQLWTIGYVWGFNSNPDIILYAKANHQPYPHVPFVWSLA